MRKRWGVLISGRGSNLAALLETRDEVDLRLVVSSSPTAYGLLRARRAGVAVAATPLVLNPATGKKKIDWTALDQVLRKAGVTHIFLAGFMKVIPASFVEAWAGRIVNLHPSILPEYPGLNSIERAFHDGAAIGLTVHEVTAEVDAGKIISQRRSLNPHEIREYSLDAVEFQIHVDEQRAVKEAIRRWSNWPMS